MKSSLIAALALTPPGAVADAPRAAEVCAAMEQDQGPDQRLAC